jgi:hypothetical protein
MNKASVLLGCCMTAVLAACGSAPPSAVSASPTLAPAVELPPAWTVTPSATPVPKTLTPTLTPPPAVAAARETAALWPPMEVVAVGAGADVTDWKRLEAPSGSILIPAEFEEIGQPSFGASTTDFMEQFAGILVAALQGEGTPAPAPASLDEFAATYGFDFRAAENAADRVSMFLVAGPLPEGFDVETILTDATGILPGEVEIVYRELVGGAPRPTGRILVQFTDPARGTVESRATYAVLGGERAWLIVFQSRDAEVFEALLPVFETIALSVQPPP